MLARPSSCRGCSLDTCATGFMHPDGQPRLGVTLLGEALGEQEAAAGRPFVGAAGFRLGKMIENAGYQRDQFQILNAVWCRPPENREPTEQEINHCRQYWEGRVTLPETRVIVPMGNVPLWATLGEEGILKKRGYVWWSEVYQSFILPTVHPSFIMRGNSKWEAAWMYDLRHAVEVARDGWEPVDRDYLLDPVPLAAREWCRLFAARLAVDPTLALGTDIETPDKSIAEDEVDINLGFLAGPIYRIGFAYVYQGRTFAMTIPWDANYRDTIQALLALACPKVFWYRHFDVPRIRAHQITIAPAIHDGAEMWKVLQSDLPKTLEHVTPYLQPRQPAWKHLNHGDTAAFYNATDAGVQVEHWYTLQRLLKDTGQWDLYWRDIHQLNAILIHMSDQGMPVDQHKRKEASRQLMALKEANREKLNTAAEAARPNKTYTQARFSEGLQAITIDKEENFCTECQKRVSGKGKKHPHFRCGTAPGEVPLGQLARRTVTTNAWIKPLDFKPSQQGLLRYAKFKGYKLITRWDKAEQKRKTPMDETSVRQYALRNPTDPLWPLVLEERELGKLLSTYIGRLALTPPQDTTEHQRWLAAVNAAGYRPAQVEKDRLPRLQRVSDTSTHGDDDIPF